MTPTEQPPPAAPFDPTVRVESQRPTDRPPTAPDGPTGGRSLGPLAIGLLLLSVTLISAGIGFVLSGGRLPGGSGAATPAATAVAQATPQPTPPQPTPTLQPTGAPKPTAPQPTTPPAPTAVVTSAPIAAIQPEPAETTPASKPTAPQATAPPAVTAPAPTARPTSPPPQPTTPPVSKPSGQPAGADPRLAQVETTVREYFAALNAQDYARAHQVCCTESWRERYPLDRWVRNFDGVTELQLVGEPRYLRIEPEVIVVDTDYTFRSGGRQRDFTLRWTFQPVGGEWQAELAEAFAR